MGNMKFTRLEVEDMFAYRGLSRVDLDACTPDRNLIIVTGRNGAGKTSLLNAVKLLFLGSENESMRRVTFGSPPLSQKHYVLGQPGRWYGVFNTLAGPTDVCARVALEWFDGGQLFKAERSFRKEDTTLGFKETLTVTADGESVSDEAAFLMDLVPKEVVPFFFFDGEQIQSIADSELGSAQVEIERLLGLSFVGVLTREVALYNKVKSHVGLAEAVKIEIVKQENIVRMARSQYDAANRARIALEEEIQQLTQAQARLEKERNGLRAGISEVDRRRMVNRIEILGIARDRVAGEIVEHLPPESPWLGNLALVRTAFTAIAAHLPVDADSALVDRLYHKLPVELVRRLAAQCPPIPLDAEQQKRFVFDVQDALADIGVVKKTNGDPLFASLSPRQIKSLHNRFLIWAEKGGELASAHAQRLRTMRQMAGEQQQIQRDLDEAEVATDDARQRFEILTQEISPLTTRSSACIAQCVRHKLVEERALKEISSANEVLRNLEFQYRDIASNNQAAQLGIKAKQALQYYLQQRRAQIRSEVEERLNKRIGMLFGHNQLIKSVALDEQFHMTYFDVRDGLVARASISAGMRQLVAMAMLWALKDLADRPLPVFIDTPLGRIDQENRALLMSEYFPQAGNPFVLLPTNTEFAAEDYLALARNIAKRYEIRNEGGLGATIVELKPDHRSTGHRL
jgi:DNA sulfur modification protein DndD